MLRSTTRLASIVYTAVMLTACASTIDRLAQIGQAPPLSPIAVPPVPVSVPQPLPLPEPRGVNALWRPGSRSFFRDPRAQKAGDILTVNIDIGDQAKIANTSSRSRSATECAGSPNFLGLESLLPGVLPDEVNPEALVNLNSDSTSTGTGSVDRSESISLTVAAVVVQVLPNGNLVIQGQQEVRVNNEVRVLQVSGIVRPEDIASSNTIKHTQIAEARISYGGRGDLSRVQKTPAGQSLLERFSPF